MKFQIHAYILINFFNELAGASLRSAPLVAWWKILLPISIYVVLGTGRTQFGILAGVAIAYRPVCSYQPARAQFGTLTGVSIAYLTLCSPQSGPGAIWDFGGSF